jgi:hypothetical protein
MATRIIFIFANVVFLGVSYMTYCREMIETKNAVRERIKLANSNKEMMLMLLTEHF